MTMYACNVEARLNARVHTWSVCVQVCERVCMRVVGKGGGRKQKKRKKRVQHPRPTGAHTVSDDDIPCDLRV